jgi:putative ATP-dependent endonuclease of OLD family
MGVVLGDLVERSKAEPQSYRALIIEEPEAHLHPQLQLLVYAFLDRTSRSDDRSQVQVFVTSHSPTLASRAELDSIVVLYRASTGKLKATAVRACPLEKKHQCDLQRYLDVTRSQLFFARGVLLVEGISEALLVPVLAERAGMPLDQAAIEVVPVSGVSFEPFARLFNSDDPAKRIDIPCSIITDDDRCSEKGAADRIFEDDLPEDIARKLSDGTPSGRCNNVTDLQGGRMAVFTAKRTLEVELGLVAENVRAIVEAVKDVGHPIIANRIETNVATATNEWTRAAIVWKNIADMKAALAQRLAWMVAEKAAGAYTRTFYAPGYILDAIRHVTARSPLDEA